MAHIVIRKPRGGTLTCSSSLTATVVVRGGGALTCSRPVTVTQRSHGTLTNSGVVVIAGFAPRLAPTAPVRALRRPIRRREPRSRRRAARRAVFVRPTTASRPFRT